MTKSKLVDSELGFYMPPIVKELLGKVRHRVLTKDRDFVMVIDGEEGSGKSVLAQQLGKFFDPNFGLDNIVFNSDDFLKVLKDPKTTPGTCIVLDEAFSAANARASLSQVNRAMVGVATEMRQKNLFVILCLPSFFDLDRFFALWRCRALIHVYFSNEDDRRYVIFPKDAKKLLYLWGKKTYNYTKPRSPYPPFKFTNHYTVDEDDYRFKKSNAFRKRVVSNQARKWLLQRNAYVKYLLNNFGIAQDDIGKIPSNYGAPVLSQRQISNIVKEMGKFD